MTSAPKSAEKSPEEIARNIVITYAGDVYPDQIDAIAAAITAERSKQWPEVTDEDYEIGRKAIEDVLRVWRDSRLSEPFRGNGLVIREKDGTESSIIRFGPESALKIGFEAIMKKKMGMLNKIS